MAIEAPISKFKKTNFKISMSVCIIAAIWFGYDGYFNKKFMEENSDDNGVPNSTLVFNQKAPPFLVGAAVLLGAYMFAIKDRKLVADENELVISAKERIPYDSIEKINKTHFRPRTKRKFVGDSQGEVQEISGPPEGHFIITYTNRNGSEVNRKLSDRNYDNLEAILDHLVAKIS